MLLLCKVILQNGFPAEQVASLCDNGILEAPVAIAPVEVWRPRTWGSCWGSIAILACTPFGATGQAHGETHHRGLQRQAAVIKVPLCILHMFRLSYPLVEREWGAAAAMP